MDISGNSPDKKTPFSLLKKTADAAMANPLSRHAQSGERIPFIGFRVCNTDYLAPVDSVPEILKMPDSVVSVPGVKTWLYGLANIRGTLLTLVDFQQFLCETDCPLGASTRVLVVNHDDVRVGLMVPESSGLVYLGEEEIESADITGGLKSVRIEGREWKLFDMQWLVENEDFRQAA